MSRGKGKKKRPLFDQCVRHIRSLDKAGLRKLREEADAMFGKDTVFVVSEDPAWTPEVNAAAAGPSFQAPAHPPSPAEVERAVRKLLARLEENYGREMWSRNPARTDLEEAAQDLARLFPPEAGEKG